MRRLEIPYPLTSASEKIIEGRFIKFLFHESRTSGKLIYSDLSWTAEHFEEFVKQVETDERAGDGETDEAGDYRPHKQPVTGTPGARFLG